MGYLNFDNDNGIMYFVSDSIDVLEQFTKNVRHIKLSTNKAKELCIYDVIYDKSVTSLNYISPLSPSKTLDSIVSREKPLITSYLQRFMEGNLYGVDSSWIPNNLGILLHGEPGLGKTSLIKAICNQTSRSAVMIDMRMIQSGEELEKIFRNYGTKDYTLVLEEIDFMSGVLTRSKNKNLEKEREREKIDLAKLLLQINSTTDNDLKKNLLDEYKRISESRTKQLDLSLLLQLMDGIVESSDRLIIATTNCPDMIDPALLRPGRFDLVIKLNYFNKDEIIELLSKLLDLNDKDREILKGQNFVEGVWSPLEIVQLVLNLNKNLFNITRALCDKPSKKI